MEPVQFNVGDTFDTFTAFKERLQQYEKNVSIFHSTAFSPRRQGNSESSYLELPTLEHVSKAFRIEIWFLTHSQGKYDDFLTFQPERPFQFRVKAVLNVIATQLSYL